MYKDIKPQNQLRFYSLDITSLCAGLLLLGTLLFCSQSVMAADDDYLRALEIEAEKSALVSKKPKTKNKRAQTPDQKEFKKFEQAMQTR